MISVFPRHPEMEADLFKVPRPRDRSSPSIPQAEAKLGFSQTPMPMIGQEQKGDR